MSKKFSITLKFDQKDIGRIPIARVGGNMKSKKGKGSYNRKKEKSIKEY